MAKARSKVKIFLDPIGDTINIWWDDPRKAFISEESDSPDLDVLVKDKRGRTIGFEKIGFFPPEIDPLKYFLRKQQIFYLSEGK